MRITHISEYYLDGWTYQENFLPEFQARLGHHVTLIASRSMPEYLAGKSFSDQDVYMAGAVKIVRYHLDKSWYRLRINGLERILAQEHPDLLFIHGFHLLRDKNLMQYINSGRVKRIIMDTHADYLSSGFIQRNPVKKMVKRLIYFFIYRPLIQKALPHIEMVFHVSPSSGVFAKKVLGIPSSKSALLKLGVDLSQIHYEQTSFIKKRILKTHGIPDSDIVILTIGKQDKLKQPVLLTQAFQTAKIPNAHLLICGSIDEELRMQVLEAASGNENIHLVGWIQPGQVTEYFLSADVGVFPGGQSVLWQLAMACGLPCIYRQCEGAEYLDGGGALFLKEDDVDELVALLKKISSDKELMRSMGSLQRKHALEHFDYHKIALQSITPC